MAHRILMVDDERDLVFATKLYLEAEDYEVLAAYDGHEALEVLEAEPRLPDLVILDVFMPRMSGWDVLRMIRGQDRTRSLPVIMLTAAGQDADKARGWDLGVDWYQTKPFDPKDLLVVIERVLAVSREQADENGFLDQC
ncbi:MAG: response regulator transcription factor [Armatimonadetes bacterium]|nr:response regulator transcription factor [Armatimonadota bacterium]